MINNQKGFITLDFLFAMVLILGFTTILFTITMTLTTASIVQYITFASARNYFAAHADPSNQVQMAEKKFAELIDHPVFKPLLSNGWFEIQAKPDVGDISKIKSGFVPDGKNKFWGVGTPFTARILDFKIPLFGSTDPEGSGDGSNFQTYLGSFLGREPTSTECWEFTRARWRAIRALSVSGGASYSTNTSNDDYRPIEDSGC